MDIMFPTKGWDTNSPQNAKPEGASADLLNVVPFDRDQILRGAVRKGISKFSTTQLGSGSQPVLLVQQVTRALDPASVNPSNLLVNEGFAYSNGNLDTVSGGLWVTKNGSFVFSGSASTDAVISSGHVAPGGTMGSRYLPSLTLGTGYIIKMRVTFANYSNAWGAAIGFRSDPAHLNDGIYLSIAKASATTAELSFRKFNLNSLYGSAVVLTEGTDITAGSSLLLEVRVSGNSLFAFVNGVQKISVTTSDFSGQSAFGFFANPSGTAMQIDDFQVYAADPLASFRATSVVAVCGGSIYEGASTGMVVATNGATVLSSTIKPQMAQFAGLCYFVDSAHDVQVLNTNTSTVSTLAVSAGTETATTLGAYTLACTWHGRVVYAASVAFPMNFVMSRQNAPTDFDYSQTDEAAALAGNASNAGAIGDPLNALMPWTDDVLLLGGDHTIYKVEGDPAAGGQILNVSDAVGTVGPDCWDVDPFGNLYFVGTGGVYRLAAGSNTLENIASDTVRKFFNNINRVTHYVALTWDRDANGLFIHVTPANPGAATHLFWDATTKGFFPLQYPNSFGPTTTEVFDGDGPTDRQLLLACRDGYIRKYDPAAISDDGTDITSYVLIGPFRPAGDAALSVLEAIEIILGDPPTGLTQNDFGIKISTLVGTDAYRALAFPTRTVSFTVDRLVARRKRRLQRISGGTFFFKLEGIPSRVWSFEKLVALFTEGGLQRRWPSVQD